MTTTVCSAIAFQLLGQGDLEVACLQKAVFTASIKQGFSLLVDEGLRILSRSNEKLWNDEFADSGADQWLVSPQHPFSTLMVTVPLCSFREPGNLESRTLSGGAPGVPLRSSIRHRVGAEHLFTRL